MIEDYNNWVGRFGTKLFNQSNFNIWKICLEPYLIGEDVWDVVDDNTINAIDKDKEIKDIKYKNWIYIKEIYFL